MGVERKVKHKVGGVTKMRHAGVPVEDGPADEGYFERAGVGMVSRTGKAPRNVQGELDRALKECQRLCQLNAGMALVENRLVAENGRLRAEISAYRESQRVEEDLGVVEEGPQLEG